MSDLKWIKIRLDMFDNRKIKYLRSLPEGDKIVLIWIQLLVQAGKCNAGGHIFISENVPYTIDSLANELQFDKYVVQMAMSSFERLNMIKCNGDDIYVTGWKENQSIEEYNRVKEQNRIRKQNQREREKLALLPTNNNTKSRDSHVTMRDSHAIEQSRVEQSREEQNRKEKCVCNTPHTHPKTLAEVQRIADEVGKGSDARIMYLTFQKYGWPQNIEETIANWVVYHERKTLDEQIDQMIR